MAWDDELFARIGESYDQVFAREVARTEEQTEFAVRTLTLRPGQRVLDVCCGPGRHALALARRGMLVTAVERDASLLAMARRRARAGNLGVEWVAADARRLPRIGPFHGALCMFASWGYAAEPADNGRILTVVAERLLPGARFLLDIPNLEWLSAHPRGRSLSLAGGTAVRERRHFDGESRVLRLHWRVRQPGRPAWDAQARYRVYALDEMEWMLASSGLVLEAAFGDFDGGTLSVASPRCLLLARRPVLPALTAGTSARAVRATAPRPRALTPTADRRRQSERPPEG